MQLPKVTPHRLVLGVVLAGSVAVAALLNVNLAAGDSVERLETAATAATLAGDWVLLAAVGAIGGLGVGLVVGALYAFDAEVAGR